jgi:hypothetical protein
MTRDEPDSLWSRLSLAWLRAEAPSGPERPAEEAGRDPGVTIRLPPVG